MNWKSIEYLEDCETLESAIKTTKDILDMYNEPETTFYNDLYCNEFKDNEKNKQIRKSAKKHIKQLKDFVVKSDNSIE